LPPVAKRLFRECAAFVVSDAECDARPSKPAFVIYRAIAKFETNVLILRLKSLARRPLIYPTQSHCLLNRNHFIYSGVGKLVVCFGW
jgi:hypothetical protein